MLHGTHEPELAKKPAGHAHAHVSVLYGLPAAVKTALAGLVVHATHAPSPVAVQAERYCPTPQLVVVHVAQVCPLR
jgi:hypothetical protein